LLNWPQLRVAPGRFSVVGQHLEAVILVAFVVQVVDAIKYSEIRVDPDESRDTVVFNCMKNRFRKLNIQALERMDFFVCPD
jgi:hypothetical protein